MLERPIPILRALGSFDNIFQLGLRCRYKLKPQRNPRNWQIVSADQFDQYYKFAVVRNPWTRAFSWYKNCMRDSTQCKRYGLREDTKLSEFLNRYVGRGSLRPQTSWIANYRGQIRMDYVARFESLQCNFDKICSDIGVPGIALPHLRKGSGEDYRRSYDTASIRLIAETYRSEINEFGYTFEA